RRPAGASAGNTSARPSPPPMSERLVTEAQVAFRKMKFAEAESYCRQALRLDRRCALAYEILGDIHRARGRMDEAIAMYSYAMQMDTYNRELQMKFERAAGPPPRTTTTARSAQTSRPAPRRREAEPSNALTPTRTLVNGLGMGGLAFLIIFIIV